MLNILIAGSGAALGSVVRFLVMDYGKRITKGPLPMTTLLINLLGAFLLGLLAPLTWSPALKLFLGTGIIGGFTTFSTFMGELLSLHDDHRTVAWVYAGLTIIIGIGVGLVGIYVGRGLM
ncbi:fluoride efflux transporter FluC [Periweissella ghanensis]|uniref:Fluoride-specific ion channel FluC n=1 Tax=Periweissella ghanensis TaxID=467997 RepID=A0ABN8BQ27_9LACO|nr:CrcB family protein [Periweissella ghanensis]CAH0418714.1 Putative fluoride ion transporter CrcB [Periweissella ghanensis]